MKMVQLDNQNMRRLRAALLRWYDRHKRDMPWREPRPDPYRVLVSEAMLQQTQVATVIAYFERFVARWPTVRDLAAAEEQEVLRMWQGLGYYRRARHLHAAAKAIVEQHSGVVPDTVEGLLSLPGVGRYTAGAVASIAFGRRAAVLDGNVMRVLARVLAVRESIDDAEVKAALWDAAEHLVPGARPGDFNQAMMELGAMVCVPRNPQCLMCPIAGVCRANAKGIVERLPVRAKPQAARAVTHHVVAVQWGTAFLFEQRPSRGLWSNMWQMPTAEALPGEADAVALRRWLKDHCGCRLNGVTRIGSFAHQTTHRAITFVVWSGRAIGKQESRGSTCWRAIDALDDLPLSKAQQRALKLVRAAANPESAAR